jgi:hypothetical protein
MYGKNWGYGVSADLTPTRTKGISARVREWLERRSLSLPVTASQSLVEQIQVDLDDLSSHQIRDAICGLNQQARNQIRVMTDSRCNKEDEEANSEID